MAETLKILSKCPMKWASPGTLPLDNILGHMYYALEHHENVLSQFDTV